MKAIVLCAGYGTRLGDLTRSLPKPMLPLEGKPLLGYTLRYLANYGFDQIAINLHYKADLIKDYVGNGSRFGVRVHYSWEDSLLGTAGTIKNLRDYLADEEYFLTVYGDLLIDQDLSEMLETHRQNRATATLLLHQNKHSNSIVSFNDQGRITQFIERPPSREGLTTSGPWANSGVYLLSHRILDYIPIGHPADFPRDVFIQVVDKEALYACPLSGYRCAIDSVERYQEACAAVREGRYQGDTPGNRTNGSST